MSRNRLANGVNAAVGGMLIGIPGKAPIRRWVGPYAWAVRMPYACPESARGRSWPPWRQGRCCQRPVRQHDGDRHQPRTTTWSQGGAVEDLAWRRGRAVEDLAACRSAWRRSHSTSRTAWCRASGWRRLMATDRWWPVRSSRSCTNPLPPTTRCISRLEPWTCVRTSFVRRLTDLPRMCRRRSTHERVGRGRRGWSHASVAVGLLPPATRRCRRARAPSLCRWHERRRAASVRRGLRRGELRQQRERRRGAADRRGEARRGKAGRGGRGGQPRPGGAA